MKEQKYVVFICSKLCAHFHRLDLPVDGTQIFLLEGHYLCFVSHFKWRLQQKY